MDIMKMMKKLLGEVKKFLLKLNNMKMKEKLFLVVLFVLCYFALNIVVKQCQLMERFAPIGDSTVNTPTGADPSANTHKLVMYSMSTCGHCNAAKPAFKKLMEKKIPNAQCELKEDAREDKEWSSVKGFPTFKLHKSDGETVVYGDDKSKCLNGECKRDALSLEHFLNECTK